VYRGTRIRLTVARTVQWVTVFSKSGSDGFQSDPFTVPDRWRIRYRLSPAAGILPALARFTWTGESDGFGDSFFAHNAGASTRVMAGAGTYRLTVEPFAGTNWSVEVDAYK